MDDENLHQKLSDLLGKIEAEMRQLNLWHAVPPPAEALNSQLPFCHDTLQLSQWLQFVLIARMQALIESRGALPGECAIAPYAEEYFTAGDKNASGLLLLLKQLDEALTAQPAN